MRKFGLIGFPLGHSFSKGFFTKKFELEHLSDCSYENYPLQRIADLPVLTQSESELIGLNVTIPYKEQVIPYLDAIDQEAEKIGAVNAIKISRLGGNIKLKGYNTDVVGFEDSLSRVLKPFHISALILGTGGASKAVAYVLQKLNIQYRFVSRNPTDSTILSYSELTSQIIRQHKIIVNTSPVGMYPNIGDSPPIPYGSIGPEHILYDLIYNPEMTLFLKQGEEKKALLINGMPMLIGQAERSWQLWNS